MKKHFIAPALMVAFISFANAGFSQTKTPEINKTEKEQQKRIAQGVKSGELTAKETENLEAREAKIQHDKKEAKADGTVTKAERTKLRREQNRASRAIYRQKHDAQKRH